MTLYLYFYLVHFLADYPLQSFKLVQYKRRSFLGVLIHSTVHLLTLLIFLFPFLPNAKLIFAILIVYITHNIIDQTKVTLNKSHPQYRRFLYFLDQTLHCSIITTCVYFVGSLQPKYLSEWFLKIYSNQSVILYLLTLVLTTYFLDVSRHFISKNSEIEDPFKRDYITMTINALIVTVLFIVYWVILNK